MSAVAEAYNDATLPRLSPKYAMYRDKEWIAVKYLHLNSLQFVPEKRISALEAVIMLKDEISVEEVPNDTG